MTSTFRPAMLLMTGRALGALAAFAIPLCLVRILDPVQFGTYKQIFLLYSTFFVIAQIGMAECLYYFLPHDPARTGRYIANSILGLGAAGAVCLVLLIVAAPAIAAAMNNPHLTGVLPMLGACLALMLAASVIEIALTARGRCFFAASSYLASDLLRAALCVVPVVLYRSLEALLAGVLLFAALRLAAGLVWLRREYGNELRPDAALMRRQLAWALPFAAAIVAHAIQENFHQYIVSSRFDAATFAVYAVGCLQIPLVDFLATSASSVMMVRMAEAMATGRAGRVVALWHDTTRKLALVLFPLAGLILVNAREIILILFTSRFAAGAPILALWSLSLLPAAIPIDGALRVYAQTRYLLFINVCRIALILILIGPCIELFGLPGAVLVSLTATAGGKAIALVRIGRLLDAGPVRILPWGHLVRIAAAAAGALAPALLVRAAALTPWWSVAATGTVYVVSCAALLVIFGVLEAPGSFLPRAAAWWSGRLPRAQSQEMR